MNDGQLESFIAAVDAGSFRKAAKEQFLTVPSFSQRIKALESELGYTLFERDAQGVTPTAQGLDFYESARQALAILHSAKEGYTAKSEKPQSLKVGVWWRATPYLLEACEQFTSCHPDISVDFVEVGWDSAPSALAEGKIDVSFGARSFDIERLGLGFTQFAEDIFYCVFSPQCPLVEQALITSEMLDDYIVYAGTDWSAVPELAEHTRTFFRRENVKKKSVFSEKLLVDCLQGKAVSFFGVETLSYVCPPLVAKPLDWPSFAVGACHSTQPSPRLEEFIALCKEHFLRRTGKLKQAG